MSTFEKYARYYDLLYADKNYGQEVAYVDELIKAHRATTSSILEFGCGTGKHARLLVDCGYAVHGIDLSFDMITCAQQWTTHENLTFICSDMRSVNLGKTFDVVISLFHVMSYQATNEDLDSVFARANEHLASGGLFIFDAWYGPSVLTERPAVRVKRVENDAIRVVRVAEPVLHTERSCVEVNFTVFFVSKKTGVIETFTEQHVMRYLFVPEIETLCKKHGFELVLHEEWLTRAPLSCSTWGACFVLRKQ